MQNTGQGNLLRVFNLIKQEDNLLKIVNAIRK